MNEIKHFLKNCPSWQLRLAVAIVGIIISFLLGWFTWGWLGSFFFLLTGWFACVAPDYR